MMYKIVADINVSGKTKGDTFEAEPHAVALYLERGQIEEIKKIIKKFKKK